MGAEINAVPFHDDTIAVRECSIMNIHQLQNRIRFYPFYLSVIVQAVAQSMIDYHNITNAGLSLLTASTEIVHHYRIPARTSKEVALLEAKFENVNKADVNVAALDAQNRRAQMKSKNFMAKMNQQTKEWSGNLFKTLIGNSKSKKVTFHESSEQPPSVSDDDAEEETVRSCPG